MRRLWLTVLTLITALVLASCGGSTAQSPTAAPEPTTRPTLTPRADPTKAPEKKPTEKPEEEPTEEPEEEPTEEPVEDPTGQVTRDIDMENLETYTYDTGIFSIDIPASWSSENRGSDTEVLVRFTDESQNGVVLVDLFEQTEPQTDEELIKLLEDYLDNTYTAQDEFSRDEPQTQADGSILVVWGYDVQLNGKTVRLLGNTFIEQRDNLISVLTIALPDEQFDALNSSINDILNSYNIDTSVPVSGEILTPTEGSTSDSLQMVEIGDLETYTYDTGLFSIDVPNNWTLKDNSKSGEAIVLWTDPTQNGLIVVDIFNASGEQTSDELTELLENFLSNSFGSEPDFTMDKPKAQSDGSQLIVWSYTANASGGVQAKLLGNSFIEQRGDKISILTTTVPNEQFSTLLESTNKIINSYSIDPSADLP